MFKPTAKKYYKHALAALCALLVLLSLHAFYFAPRIAHGRITAALQKTGFDTSYMPKPRAVYGAVLYENVAFDKDSFTTLKYLQATYNPFTLFFGKFKNLDLVGLNITGDWSDQEFSSLSFAGWTPPAGTGPVPLNSFRHINIKNGRLALLTQNAGGVSVFFDIVANLKDEKTEFEASIKTEQKYLSAVASASGVVEGPRWYADLEIINGKFEDPAGRFWGSRMNGWFNFSRPESAPLKIMSELRAGGFNLYDLPWQNASATLEYENDGLKFFTGAKSVGHEGLELEISAFQSPGARPAFSGTIHAENGQAFFDYFANRPLYAEMLKKLRPYQKSQNVDIVFSREENILRYEIRHEGKSTEIFGEIAP